MMPELQVGNPGWVASPSIGLQILAGARVADSGIAFRSMGVSAGSWAEAEFGQAELGDARRTQRLIKLASQRGAQPNASIPQECGDKAATKAAYRFYENSEISHGAILRSHQQATCERLRAERIVLAVQDTTDLNYTAHPATTGLGILNDANHHGLLVHTTLAVTPQRVPLGILDQQVWGRPETDLGKRHQRKKRPISEKESQKWLSSLEAIAHLQAQLPETHLISVGDREADVYDLFLQAQTLKQDVVVRAAWDRGVVHPEKHLWAYVGSRPVAGSVTISVPRKTNQRPYSRLDHSVCPGDTPSATPPT